MRVYHEKEKIKYDNQCVTNRFFDIGKHKVV